MATDDPALMYCTICEGECTGIRAISHAMGATPAPVIARPLCDETASIDLDDRPLDGQACRDRSEGLESIAMRCLKTPDTKHSPLRKTSSMANESTGVNEPTRHPAFLRNATRLPHSTKRTSIKPKVCHPWLGSLLGLGSLTLAIVSLMMYTIRSYRMAVWATRNDELQTCIGLIQAERPVGPNCERLISDGPQDPPYNLSRRTTDPRAPGRSFKDISIIAADSYPAVEMQHSAWLVLAAIFILISLACLLFNLLHHRCITDYGFDHEGVIEKAISTYRGQTKKLKDETSFSALFPIVPNIPSTDLRKRTTRVNRQEMQDDASIDNWPVDEETLPYSLARFLDQPAKAGTIGVQRQIPWGWK